MLNRCDFCGHLSPMVFVHGHYQCTQCHQVCITCCEGSSNCEIQIPMGEGTQKTNIPIDNVAKKRKSETQA